MNSKPNFITLDYLNIVLIVLAKNKSLTTGLLQTHNEGLKLHITAQRCSFETVSSIKIQDYSYHFNTPDNFPPILVTCLLVLFTIPVGSRGR